MSSKLRLMTQRAIAGVQSFALLARANSTPTITSQPAADRDGGRDVSLRRSCHRRRQRCADVCTLTAAPAGMTIDNLGRIVWETTTADFGAKSVTIVVADSHGASSTPQSFTLNVTPDTTAPVVLLTASSTRVAVGGDIVLTVAATRQRRRGGTDAESRQRDADARRQRHGDLSRRHDRTIHGECQCDRCRGQYRHCDVESAGL